MTLDERNGVAVERTGNSLSSDLRSVLTGTSRMFELFTSTFAVMKDRIGARRKVVDLQLSESDALAQSPSNSSLLSLLGAGNFVCANSLIERSLSAPAVKGRKNNPATRTSSNHIGARIGAKPRSGVVLNVTNQSSEQLVPSSNGGTFSSFQSTGSGKGDDGYEVSGNGTTFDESVAELDSKRTDVHLSAEEHLAVPLDGVKGWKVRANPAIMRSVNPIRRITDTLVLNKENGKDLISLAVGDPALFGPHMKVPDVANSAVIDVVTDGRYNGYTLSSGLLEARRAVAEHLSAGLEYRFNIEDVIMTSGCSQAIQHSLDVLRFDGCNFLVPRPGFPIYETLCSYYGVECRHYDLLQDRSWEVDLVQVSKLADNKTAAIVICNPGNPCGTVYEYDHLSQIAAAAENLRVPIIADEVYSSLVFGQNPFISMARFSSKAPVLTVGGVSKNWLAPGWRLGWLAVSDPRGILGQARVREAITKVAQMTPGACTLMQAALPTLLRSTPASFFENVLDSLRSGAELCYRRVEKIAGLDCPWRPQGSMFMMVRFDPSAFLEMKNDVDFSAALLKEESVLVLPGSAFGRSNWIRIVFGLSMVQLGEAWDRIEEFCKRHVLSE